MAVNAISLALRPVAVWIGLMLALNLGWELAQFPLYAFYQRTGISAPQPRPAQAR
jgi:hypothetical protein